MSRAVVILVLNLLAVSAWASDRKPVPLLPERLELASYYRPHRSYRARSYRSSRPMARYSPQTSLQSSYRRETGPSGWGFELGALTRSNNAEGAIAGLELIPGGRFATDFEIASRWHLRPTAGFFYRAAGEGKASVAEHHIELGVSALYDVSPRARSHVYLGVANRFDATFSKLSAFDSSDTTPIGFQYRVGPAMSFEWATGYQSAFVLGVEGTFNASEAFRFYGGITAGFIYRVW